MNDFIPALRKWIIRLAAAAFLSALAVLLWWQGLAWFYRGDMLPNGESGDLAADPGVAIVFGARVYPNGYLSAMLRDRVETAVGLYHAGAVRKIIMSGDNRFEDYNEPEAMMAYAISRGVPAEALQPDYAGRRTYDTCYRAKEIFGLEKAVLVTQEFHLPRALFTCQGLGVDVQGVAADRRTYSRRSMSFSTVREIPAAAVALLDVIRQQPAAVLGQPIPLD